MFGRNKKPSSISISTAVIDKIVKPLKERLDALEKIEQDKKDQETDRIGMEKALATILPYEKSKGSCSKCDGAMLLDKRITVSELASMRREPGQFMYGLHMFGEHIPNGDDKREVLQLVCASCEHKANMWAKDVEVKGQEQ